MAGIFRMRPGAGGCQRRRGATGAEACVLLLAATRPPSTTKPLPLPGEAPSSLTGSPPTDFLTLSTVTSTVHTRTVSACSSSLSLRFLPPTLSGLSLSRSFGDARKAFRSFESSSSVFRPRSSSRALLVLFESFCLATASTALNRIARPRWNSRWETPMGEPPPWSPRNRLRSLLRPARRTISA